MGLGILVLCGWPFEETAKAFQASESARIIACGVRRTTATSPEVNAECVVRFDRPMPSYVFLTPPTKRGVERACFRDDGRQGDDHPADGYYTARLSIDLAELARDQNALHRLAQSEHGQSLPHFEGRTLEGRVSLRPVPGALAPLDSVLDLPSIVPLQQEYLVPPFDPRAFNQGQFVALLPFADPLAVDPERSLIVRHPSVVGDPSRTYDPITEVGNPEGCWTFAHLMTQLANEEETGITPSSFVRSWLRHWEHDQVVNGFRVPARRLSIDGKSGIVPMILDPWIKRSAQEVGSPPQLDLRKAPFRLLAIVNRIDLRDNLVREQGSAGEVRFVFGAVDLQNDPPAGRLLPFSVILEYDVRVPSCREAQEWGRRWLALQNHDIDSIAYRESLEELTESVVRAGTQPEQRPNQSALKQLRTNEIALSTDFHQWEMREFRLAKLTPDPGGFVGYLRQFSSQQSPNNIPDFDEDLNMTSRISRFINQHAEAILRNEHLVPEQFEGESFLSGAVRNVARNGVPGTDFWDGDTKSIVEVPNARHLFSLNTCNGCHGGETKTKFTHIKPELAIGSHGAVLSPFLTGPITVVDPSGERDPLGDPLRRDFDEILRRRTDLARLVFRGCLTEVFQAPLEMVH